MAPRFSIEEIALFERFVPFRKPFRFGAVTVEGAPQAFVRVLIDVEGFGRALGATAELMVPKWFDKNPALTPAQTIDGLRRSLHLARSAYLDRGRDTAFGFHAERIGAHIAACASEDIPALAAAFGPAEIDKAILDALLKACGLDVFAGLRRNIVGLDARLTPNLTTDAVARFLETRIPLEQVAVRHTVGLVDLIGGPGCVIAGALRKGIRYLKIKLGGDVETDHERLGAIASVLAHADVKCTLDANEQYAGRDALRGLVAAIIGDPGLAPIASTLLYIEQPLPRELTRETDIGGVTNIPVIIDEADDAYDAFPNARMLGYRGVSSKSCKGFYKSLLNGARAIHANDGAFVAAEDLTCQPGLALQQDTALVAFLGIAHAERNGHIYGDGFGLAPKEEARAFAAAHPTLYVNDADRVTLRITDGAVDASSLAVAGFASGTEPDWDSLEPLRTPHHEDIHAH